MARRKKAEPTGNDEDQTVIIKDPKIWTGEGLREGSILIEKGKVKKIGIKVPAVTSNQINARGLLALPGLIDVHVHLRDMEFSYKEDFTSGTSAAAAGGFTSLLDMPNSKPPTDSPERLKERMEVASRKILVNVGFHTAAVRSATSTIQMAELGAFSLKLYMPHPISPIEVENDEEVLRVMKIASRISLPVTVHAEEPSLLHDPSRARTYRDLARTRPPSAEYHSVRRILRLQQLSNCSVHFAHITLPPSLTLIEGRHSRNVTSEVTPHHLLLSELQLERLGWKAWMVPPLRRPGVRRQLLSAVSRGLATMVASDHAPHSIDEKRQSVAKVPPGIPGLETTLPLLLTLVSKGKMSLKRMVNMLSANPAERFGIPSKGRLTVGADGDVTLVDPRKRSRVNPENFMSKAKYSPFEGFETQGGVEKTIVAGRVVFDSGRIIAPVGVGQVLRRVS